jgi:NAD+ synthase (glutamine-hydrolysing)
MILSPNYFIKFSPTMNLVKIGFASLNTTVGAFDSNTAKVMASAREMAAQKCTAGCFQEQVISGYPCEDLVQWHGFVEAQWRQLERFAEMTARLDFPTVFTLGLTVKDSGHIYNCAAVVCAGKILGLVPKEMLPTYGVFYESRTFTRGVPGRVTEIHGVPFGDLIFKFPFGTIAVEVCEDIWSSDGPMRRRAYSGAELVINASASPWRAGVVETRHEMISTRAADNVVAVVYVNQVGGNDSLVFDAGGFINQCGRMIAAAPCWRESLTTQVIDLDVPARLRHENTTWRTDCENFQRNHQPVHAIVSPLGPEADRQYAYPRPKQESFFLKSAAPKNFREELFEDLLQAMITGLGDYFEKTGAFKRIGIALSGGKDSALTLIVAWLYAQQRFANLPEAQRRAAVRDFIHCFSMPTRFNTETTKNISQRLVEELEVTFKEISIEEAFAREVEAARAMLGPEQELTKTTVQNIQARLRGMRMWNWANSAGGMWLQTGNMSEKAVGYTTIGGDMMGAYSILGNVPKTLVVALLHDLEEKHGWESVKQLLATKASAELDFGQEDEKDLMPFEVLDACFRIFAGDKLMPVELYQALRARFTDQELRALRPDYQPEMLKAWVKKFVTLFAGAIYKWVQAPQSVHLGNLDLDRERALQLPVVQSREWLELEKLEMLRD